MHACTHQACSQRLLLLAAAGTALAPARTHWEVWRYGCKVCVAAAPVRHELCQTDRQLEVVGQGCRQLQAHDCNHCMLSVGLQDVLHRRERLRCAQRAVHGAGAAGAARQAHLPRRRRAPRRGRARPHAMRRRPAAGAAARRVGRSRQCTSRLGPRAGCCCCPALLLLLHLALLLLLRQRCHHRLSCASGSSGPSAAC